MTTDDRWFAASIGEVGAFLDKFEGQKTVTVKADSDLVAALLGLIQGLSVLEVIVQHTRAATALAALLESPVENLHQG